MTKGDVIGMAIIICCIALIGILRLSDYNAYEQFELLCTEKGGVVVNKYCIKEEVLIKKDG